MISLVAPHLVDQLEPGIWEGMSEEEYNEIRALRSSRLKDFYDCPSDYDWYEKHPKPDKDVYRVGRGIHHFVLQPEEYKKLYVNDLTDISKTMARGSDTWKKRIKEGAITEKTKDRTEWLTWHAEQARLGRTVLPPKERDIINFVGAHILRHPHAKRLVTPDPELKTQVEVGAVAKDSVSGIWMKARADHRYWSAEHGCWLIVDLKTTRDASTRAALYDVGGKYNYWLQAEHHRRVFEQATGKKHAFAFVFFQKTAPYRCCTVDMADYAEVGGRLLSQTLELFAKCQTLQVWSDHSEHVLRAQPTYKQREEAEAYALSLAERGEHAF